MTFTAKPVQIEACLVDDVVRAYRTHPRGQVVAWVKQAIDDSRLETFDRHVMVGGPYGRTRGNEGDYITLLPSGRLDVSRADEFNTMFGEGDGGSITAEPTDDGRVHLVFDKDYAAELLVVLEDGVEGGIEEYDPIAKQIKEQLGDSGEPEPAIDEQDEHTEHEGLTGFAKVDAAAGDQPDTPPVAETQDTADAGEGENVIHGADGTLDAGSGEQSLSGGAQSPTSITPSSDRGTDSDNDGSTATGGEGQAQIQPVGTDQKPGDVSTEMVQAGADNRAVDSMPINVAPRAAGPSDPLDAGPQGPLPTESPTAPGQGVDTSVDTGAGAPPAS